MEELKSKFFLSSSVRKKLTLDCSKANSPFIIDSIISLLCKNIHLVIRKLKRLAAKDA